MSYLRSVIAGLLLAGLLPILNSCHFFRKEKVFQRLAASETGVDFQNTITESDSMNARAFEYIYNGGGVGVGDVNNDSLPDLFFAGNMVSSRLYLNKGNFKFEDITLPAGVGTRLWCTGVALTDINQDGLLDIYLSTIHPKRGQSVPNLLFVNRGLDKNGVPRFEEVAAKVGLADSSYATQAAFLDYDRDGDLDMYLLTNALEGYSRNNLRAVSKDGSAHSVDKLFRNEGIRAETGLPQFRNVSQAAGILDEGWGLGVTVRDINNDNYPDIYVANDFISSDLLYINNQDGTFTNQVDTLLKHTSHNSMGIDIADFNNDGFEDICVVDMMPDDNFRRKGMFNKVNYDAFYQSLRLGYHPQFVRNMLQLNQGNGTFSDIGYLAGVYATDWSWSPLFADLDNDGWRDLLITNGYKKDVTNLDFITYNESSSFFGGKTEEEQKKTQDAFKQLEGVHKPNFLFHNNRDLTFTNKAPEWGLTEPSYTNGTVYADLDRDGDLDLVMNNINEEAFIYRNNTLEFARENQEGFKADEHNYLRLRLNGNTGNLEGIGAKITLFYQGKMQYAEQALQRGYKSTVEPVLHLGLGKVKQLDSLQITWPNGKTQHLENIPVNRVLTLHQKDATHQVVPVAQNPTLFSEVADQYAIRYKHEESDFVDFNYTRTLPCKHSQDGPALSVGDVNGDERADFFVGAAAHHNGTFFLQTTNGKFAAKPLQLGPKPKNEEDAGTLLFDADQDGDLDLYCVSGSSEFLANLKRQRDRLYKNDGKGIFSLDTLALPPTEAAGSAVVASDYDKDGDLDLFVGGRVEPTRYPESPRSYLLQNDGKGRFTDVTRALSPELEKPGMVTAALWSDVDNDGWTDLLLAGEFMPIRVFKNSQGKKLASLQLPVLAHSGGWWNSLTGGDFDNDGDTDYIAGNVGLNSYYKASPREPVCVYGKDFNADGSFDPLLSHFLEGKEVMVHPRGTLIEQVLPMRRRFITFADYGRATLDQTLTEEDRHGALLLKAEMLTSVYLENRGGGNFALKELPKMAQFSPMNGILPTDINHDGILDILAVGNSYSPETLTGRYDASPGWCLTGDGKGGFIPLSIAQTGFVVDGDAKALVTVPLQDRALLVASQNQGTLRVFEQKNAPAGEIIRLQPDDAYALITLANGRKRRQEFYYGTSYFSQSGRYLSLDNSVKGATIFSVSGKSRKVK